MDEPAKYMWVMMGIEQIEHRNSEVKKDGAWGGEILFTAEFLCSISSMSIMTHIYMSGSSNGSHVQDVYMFNIRMYVKSNNFQEFWFWKMTLFFENCVFSVGICFMKSRVCSCKNTNNKISNYVLENLHNKKQYRAIVLCCKLIVLC